jgi:amino acid transporter
MAENVLPTEALASTEVSDRQLHKSLSFWELFCLGMSAIVGSGWLFATLDASSFAGPAVFIAWIIGGILILFIALNYAELAGMLPRSGAIVRYPHLTHGSYTGYLMAWTYFLTGIMVPVIEAEAVATYFSSLFNVFGSKGNLTLAGSLLVIGLTIVFFLLNYFGIKFLGRLNLILTIWKFIIPVLTFIFLFILFQASNFTAGGGLAPRGWSFVFQAIPLTGIVFAFLGFRQAVEYSGEGKNPQRDVPRATIICVLTATALYTLLQLAFIGAINWSKAGVNPGDWVALSSTKLASAPLALTLQNSGMALLVAFASLLYIDSAISPGATGMVYIGTGTRTLYGTAVDGYAPGVFSKMNRFGIPLWSLVATVVIGWLVLLPFPSWYKLVGIISNATVLTYVMGGVGLLVLRRVAPEMKRPFRLGGAGFWAPVGFIAAALIIFWSGTSEVAVVSVGVYIGLPIYGWIYGIRKMGLNAIVSIVVGILMAVAMVVIGYFNQAALGYTSAPATFSQFILFWVEETVAVIVYSAIVWFFSAQEKRHEIWRAAWLVALIQGLLLISYFTSFGPNAAKAPIPFPLDTLVAIVYALIIFYWGYYSGYKTEEISEILGQQSEGAVEQVSSAD